MARIIEDQVNVWGRDQGIDAQRADLWVIDLRQALSGVKDAMDRAITDGTRFPTSETLMVPSHVLPSTTVATYFARSVALPELKVKADTIRRDSRPYQMPSWDEPVDAIRVSFLLDCFRGGRATDPYQSDIYNLLDLWRALVRAGRGGLGAEYAVRLDNDFRIDYAFDVPVRLLRPGIPEITNGQAPLNQFGQATPTPNIFNIDVDFANSKSGQSVRQSILFPASIKSALNWSIVQNDLQEALVLTLIKCWLSSFRVSDLSYEQGRVVQIDATFYAENVQQKPLQAG